MHIPKTAGTSLRDMFQSVMNNGHIFPSQSFLEKHRGYPPLSDLLKFDSEIKSSSLFVGHYPFRNVKKLFRQDRKVITFLREPVDRTISHLRHVKLHNPKFQFCSLEEIFGDDTLKTQFDNMQIRYFLGYDQNSEISEIDFLNAKSEIVNYYFIGLSENFKSHSKKLFQLLKCNKFKQLRSNTFQDKVENKIDDFKPSENLIKMITEKNKWDLMFYKHVKKLGVEYFNHV